MQRGWIAIFALLCISIPAIGPMITNASAEDTEYEPGYVNWEGKNLHRIYLSGSGEDVNLTRDYLGKGMGNIQLSPTQQSVSIDTISMPPLETGFNGSFEISTFVAAYVVSGSGVLWGQCRDETPVTIETQVTIGNYTYFGSASEAITETSGESHNLSTEVEFANITAWPGDIISFSMTASSACPASINVEWGGNSVKSGGIVIQGELTYPEVEVTVDDSRLAHVQFTPTLPWGFDDLNMDFTLVKVYGPVPSDEERTYEEDLRVDSFNPTTEKYSRDDNLGRESIVWTGVNPLPEGDNILVICLKTIDVELTGTVGNNCDITGIIRFSVESDDDPIASSILWLSISGFVAIIGYLIAQLRQGIFLPLPLIAALVVMALLMIPLASTIPDMGGESFVSSDARSPSFILHQNGNGSVSLDDLLDGKKAVVIGITLPASSNAVDQSKQLENVADQTDGEVSIVQVVTGENVRMDDLEIIANITGATWPVLIDDSESRFAQRMPMGVSDSIVVIDSSGHIAFSASKSAGSDEIIDAIDAIDYGGQQSTFDTLSLFWGPGLAMLFVALPRKKYEVSEEALVPGSLWGSVALAGGLGFLLVNLAPFLASMLPIDNDARAWVDLGLLIWFVTAAVRAAMVGTPREIKFIARQVYKLFSEPFRNWRELEDFERDLLIGFWMGWFIWLANPATLPQAVIATTLTGGFGYVIGPVMLFVHVLAAGVLTLTIRFVASWGGPLSRTFGSFGSGPFSQALGWALVPISIWCLVNGLFYASNIGLLSVFNG